MGRVLHSQGSGDTTLEVVKQLSNYGIDILQKQLNAMATPFLINHPVLSLCLRVWLLIYFYTRTIVGLWGTDMYLHIQRQ